MQMSMFLKDPEFGHTCSMFPCRTKYLVFELLLHAAFAADEVWCDVLQQLVPVG